MMRIREVTSTFVDADREAVLAAVTRQGTLRPDGALSRASDARVVIRPPDGGSEAWFHVEDVPGGGTRLLHGAAVDHGNVLWTLSRKRHRERLRRTLEDDLLSVKRLAELGARRVPARPE